MRKKELYQNELSKIRKMQNSIRTLNEAINYNDDSFDGYADEEPEYEEDNYDEERLEQKFNQEVENEPSDFDKSSEDVGMEELDKNGTLDEIRKLTLQGMIKLNNQPEHPEFQALLKIFTICNKAVEPEDKDIKQK